MRPPPAPLALAQGGSVSLPPAEPCPLLMRGLSLTGAEKSTRMARRHHRSGVGTAVAKAEATSARASERASELVGARGSSGPANERASERAGGRAGVRASERVSRRERASALESVRTESSACKRACARCVRAGVQVSEQAGERERAGEPP